MKQITLPILIYINSQNTNYVCHSHFHYIPFKLYHLSFQMFGFILPVKAHQSLGRRIAWDGRVLINETAYLWSLFYQANDTYESQRRTAAASGGRLAKLSRQTARQDEAVEWNATGSRPPAPPPLSANSTRGKQYSEESSIIDILNLFAHKEGTRNPVRTAAHYVCCRFSLRGTLIGTGNHPTPVRSANTSSARANLLIPHILNVKPISFYWYSSELTFWSLT